MQIIDYKYFHGSEHRDGYVAIPELDRNRPAAPQFMKMACLDITLHGPTAFLYIDGVSMSPSEIGYTVAKSKYTPAIKTTASFIAHEWLRYFKNKHHLVHVDTLSGTCAAGIQAICEAQRLLYDMHLEEVIIIGSERISPDTLRLFKELRIPIQCGDGFVFLRVGPGADIIDCKWKFHYNDNAFVFDYDAIDTLIPDYPVDYVKVHGTGTEANDLAESHISALGKVLAYKQHIGHTQGISALLETCLVLDDPTVFGKILVTANGLGGFYGAFTLNKWSH